MAKEKIYDSLFVRYPVLNVCREAIWEAYSFMEMAFLNGGSLFTAGNGGSAADSGHITGELMKSFMSKRNLELAEIEKYTQIYGAEGRKLACKLEKGLPAFSLPSLTAFSTAVSNDQGGEYIFAQALNSVARQGDVFWGISTSGNSGNIVNAMMTAGIKGLSCIGLTGKKACRLDTLCDVVIHVPEVETYKIQELHLPVYHALCAMLESHFFGGDVCT